jgi:hypothetical protein
LEKSLIYEVEELWETFVLKVEVVIPIKVWIHLNCSIMALFSAVNAHAPALLILVCRINLILGE